jgi:succinate dehydrogenase/fumarate reductase cytochrome b subunit
MIVVKFFFNNQNTSNQSGEYQYFHKLMINISANVFFLSISFAIFYCILIGLKKLIYQTN